jgi:hypothetical protein
MQEHIPLSQRKLLSARIAYLDAMEPFARAAKGSARKAHEYLEKAFFDLVELNFDQPSTGYPLDRFLKDAATQFDSTLKGPGVPAPLGKRVGLALQNRIARINCDACSSRCSLSPNICDEGAHDHHLVAQGGLCIEPLKQMFSLALDVAKIYYERYTGLKPQYPSVVFSTHFKTDPKKLHDFPVALHATGRTQYLQCGSQVQVQLMLAPRAFDLATFAAIPYVMFHECVAHAFTGLYPAPPASLECSAQDQFGEGWMDFVTLKIMQEVFSGQGPAAPFSAKMPFRPDGIRTAETFHNARADWRASNASKDSPYISVGVDAANNFLNILNNRFRIRSPHEQLAILYCMSFEINLLTDPEMTKRTAFVTMMDELSTLPPKGKPHNARQSMILDIIRNYLRTGKINDLLEQAVNFKQASAI